MDMHLAGWLKAYTKWDPTPKHGRLIPFSILAHNITLCECANMPTMNTIIDILLLGFFFLLCRGEYTYTKNPDAKPFQLHPVRYAMSTYSFMINECIH